MSKADISALTDRDILGLTLWGEARGAGLLAQVAVGCVARNRRKSPSRYRATASTYASVCLAPRQFSCWNGNDANGLTVRHQAQRILDDEPMDDATLLQCFFLASGIMGGQILDVTGGATFYVERTMLLSAQAPTWTTRLVRLADVGPFALFREAPAPAVT